MKPTNKYTFERRTPVTNHTLQSQGSGRIVIIKLADQDRKLIKNPIEIANIISKSSFRSNEV